MIRSMTGYGAAITTLDDGVISVEARAVNSRGLSVVVKSPPGTDAWEPPLRAVAGERVKRGRVDIYVRLESAPGGAGRALDEDRVRQTLDGFRRLREEFGVGGEIDVASLTRVGGIFREEGDDRFVPDVEDVAATVERAMEELIRMREGEGARLADDLRERLAEIGAAIDEAERLAPARLERERDRLQAAVEELAGRSLDEERLAREIALIADKWNVSEELVRGRAHLEAFEEYLQAPPDEPVGKRLGFLVQELQREINTLGAKANDPAISRLVVEAKNEIERLREQVENVE